MSRSRPLATAVLVGACLCATVVASAAPAAADARHRIHVGAGVISATHLGEEMEYFFDGEGDFGRYSVKSSRVSGFGYGWRYTDKIELLLTGGRETLTYSGVDKVSGSPMSGYPYTVRMNMTMAGVRYFYGEPGDVPRFFSGISLGQLKSRDSMTGVTDVRTARQLDFFGMNFGDRLHGFVAFGLGDSGLLHAGVGAGF